jgi:hypothetical protein
MLDQGHTAKQPFQRLHGTSHAAYVRSLSCLRAAYSPCQQPNLVVQRYTTQTD